MRTIFGLILTLVVFMASAQDRTSKKNVTANNPDVMALDAIVKTYEKYIDEVNAMSASLSDIEKERAATFLAGTYSLVMESYVDNGNPAEPGLTSWMTRYRKFAGDNPYTIYTQAPVNIEFEYKLSGKRGNNTYFGLQMYSLRQGFNMPSANMSLDEIKFNQDGTFDIYISKERPKSVQNWVPIGEGDHCFLIREYFGSRTDIRPCELKVERIDNNIPTHPVALTTLRERLENANKMLVDYIAGTLEITSMLRDNALNQYPKPGAQVKQPQYGGSLYPTKDNTYEGFWVSLKPGEAIHLHGKLPKAFYASYVFYDRWYQTPDYRKINCYRTADELSLNPDGTYDIYISPETINHPNWINTDGLYEGSYSSRYMLSEDKEFPTVEVVKIKDIRKK
jgi:hypothetical protein